MSARRLIVPLAAAVVLAVPGVASAGERSVSPTGSGIECSEAMPCTLAYGVLGAQVDDEVVLAPGTYDVSASPVLQPPHRIHVRGQEGAPRPVITSSAAAQQIFFIGQPAAGTKLSHLDLHVAAQYSSAVDSGYPVALTDVQVDSQGICARLTGGATVTDSKFVQGAAAPQTCLSLNGAGGTTLSGVTVDSDSAWFGATIGSADAQVTDLTIHSKGPGLFLVGGANGHFPVIRRSTIAAGGHAVQTRFDAVITDSVLWGSGGDGARAQQGTLQLRNVTAVGGKLGIAANQQFVGQADSGHIVARSVIARGGLQDVQAFPDNSPLPCSPNPVCANGSVAIDHSVYDTHNALVPAGADNRAADPRFVDPATGDFHLLADSPAIDAGTDDALNGTHDRDGNARLQGAASDAGAYETAPPAPVEGSVGSGDPAGNTPPSGGDEQQVAPSPDTTAPVIGALKLTRRVFAVARRGTPVAAGARRGTKLRYSLTERASVRVRVQRLQRGRKPRTIATLSRSGATGANAIAFSGRIGRRALRRGMYRATLVATDAAGNRSKAMTVKFRIVRG